MKVFRTSFYVLASADTYVRIGRDVNDTYFIRSRRIRTSGKLSYGPKEGRPLNVVSDCDVLWTTLAEWDVCDIVATPPNILRIQINVFFARE